MTRSLSSDIGKMAVRGNHVLSVLLKSGPPGLYLSPFLFAFGGNSLSIHCCLGDDVSPMKIEIVSKIILNPECFLKKNCSGIQKKIRIPDKKSFFYLKKFKKFKKFQNLKFIMQRVPCESNLVMVKKYLLLYFMSLFCNRN
jgi:L-lactate utilization protein LutB